MINALRSSLSSRIRRPWIPSSAWIPSNIAPKFIPSVFSKIAKMINKNNPTMNSSKSSVLALTDLTLFADMSLLALVVLDLPLFESVGAREGLDDGELEGADYLKGRGEIMRYIYHDSSHKYTKDTCVLAYRGVSCRSFGRSFRRSGLLKEERGKRC